MRELEVDVVIFHLHYIHLHSPYLFLVLVNWVVSHYSSPHFILIPTCFSPIFSIFYILQDHCWRSIAHPMMLMQTTANNKDMFAITKTCLMESSKHLTLLYDSKDTIYWLIIC